MGVNRIFLIAQENGSGLCRFACEWWRFREAEEQNIVLVRRTNLDYTNGHEKNMGIGRSDFYVIWGVAMKSYKHLCVTLYDLDSP